MTTLKIRDKVQCKYNKDRWYKGVVVKIDNEIPCFYSEDAEKHEVGHDGFTEDDSRHGYWNLYPNKEGTEWKLLGEDDVSKEESTPKDMIIAYVQAVVAKEELPDLCPNDLDCEDCPFNADDTCDVTRVTDTIEGLLPHRPALAKTIAKEFIKEIKAADWDLKSKDTQAIKESKEHWEENEAKAQDLAKAIANIPTDGGSCALCSKYSDNCAACPLAKAGLVCDDMSSPWRDVVKTKNNATSAVFKLVEACSRMKNHLEHL